VPSLGLSSLAFRLGLRLGLPLVPVRRLRASVAARLWLLRFAVRACAVSVRAARGCAVCSRSACSRCLPSRSWAWLPGWPGALSRWPCRSVVVWSPLFLRACRLFRLLPSGRAAALARVPVRGSLGSYSGGA
jgi:hypothetical protein